MLRAIILNKPATTAVCIRSTGSLVNKSNENNVPKTLSERKAFIQELLKEELPKPYDGPERDLVNFPRKKRAVEPGKVRMGFLPDEWFQFFYKKTGVTGPYIFGTGLLTYLLSKEWYVIEDEFSTGVTIFLLSYFAIKKFGPAARQFSEKMVKEDEERLESQKRGAIGKYEELMAEGKKAIWRAEGQKILMEAKRENILMQLETEYRRRLMHVYEQTKRRLDYHLDLYNTKRKLEQNHMVDWIVNSVVKSITPEQEKEALKKCIEDLNVLSAKA